jgi:CRISPR-associated endonuclease/helicase Cas3
VHDCGKFKDEFARYLQDPNGIRGSVNHTFAGCRLLLERYHGQTEEPFRKLSAELLALAVGSHHGLFDCVGEDKQSGFSHRMTKKEIGYEESVRNFLSECASKAELDDLFRRATEELTAVFERIAGEDGQEVFFRTGLLARLLLSALIEADRRDTAEFMGNLPPKSEPEDLHAFWTPYLNRVEEKLDHFPADTPICLARREISDRCRAFAENPGGIYQLNIPTGGGKTLTSLRYALAHAAKWGKKRLIFTSPLLSILEQNAAVLRSFLDDDSIILEHHSNVIRTEESGELDHRELAVESWDAPVIITTLVQLLNTLFDGKTTAIRRFQGLCRSVIVIDEVQTVPAHMLSLFNLAVDFLVKVCGATVVLCSATQPCLERTEHPLLGQYAAWRMRVAQKRLSGLRAASAPDSAAIQASEREIAFYQAKTEVFPC